MATVGGLVVHELEPLFRDGTAEFPFEPLDFLARPATLVPRPRSHLTHPPDRFVLRSGRPVPTLG